MRDLAEMCYNCNCLILDVDVAKPGTHKKENCNPFPPNILSELAPLSPLRDRQSPIYQITQESALPLTSTRFFTKDLLIKKIKHFIAQFFFKENKSYIFPFRVSCTALSHMVVNFTTAQCWTCLKRHQTSTLDLSMEN